MSDESINQTSPPKSNSVPQVIIKWPDGLDAAPVILPLGESYEQSQEIGAMIERALSGEGAAR